jgi:outer membrane protein TolC
MKMGMGSQSAWAAMAVLCLAAAGCSTRHHRQSADTEVYATLQQRGWQVENMPAEFSIEQTHSLSFEGLPQAEDPEDFLGAEGESERDAWVLPLDRALATAVHHSRVYQNSKEQLYLAALGLTLARHQFAPLFAAGGTAVARGDSVSEDPSFQASGRVNVDWLLRDVGRISTDLTADFTRLFTHGVGSLSRSRLGLRISRPLLRNAGFLEESEGLTQAERNLLYQVREFVRFRKDFSVQIATEYYRVLGQRDAARNAYMNLEGSRQTAARTRALAREGRATQSDLGRLEQQELSAESAWIAGTRNYRRSLDDLKLRLGIPVETALVLDDRELAALTIQHPELAVDDAIRVALEARLDYQNVRDNYDDAVRQVRLAAEGLKTQVDLVADGSLYGQPGTNRWEWPNHANYDWNAGLILDLPLDRKAQRNAYRSALIALERAGRSLAQLQDEIELEVRESWRSLEQARRNYEISEIGVRLAERRVEEQTVLAEIGRARAQDQVDARNDLVDSRNQRTQALVGHTVARLQFWNNMGILYIKDNGQWEEQTHVARH